LSDEETEQILKSAGDCAESECSIDDVSDLIMELKDQQSQMENRLVKIMNMVAHLQHVNEKEEGERSPDEVKGFIRDLLRVFVHEEPKAYKAMGYTGDVGKGTSTAYDALPPKKWKPADKA
jgi:predicted nuclease with TOPRIM domain